MVIHDIQKTVKYVKSGGAPVSGSSLAGVAKNDAATDPAGFAQAVAGVLRERLGLAPPVEAPVVHLLHQPGKALRPQMAFAVAEACGGRGDSDAGLFAVAAAVELVHLASLIHDDLVDGAHQRRGAITLHQRYDPKIAVLSGDYMLGAAYALLSVDAAESTLRRLGPAVHALAEAELLEVQARGQAVDYATCRRIAAGKTGALFGWAAAGAAIEAGEWSGEVAWQQWGETVGLLFQMADDLGDRLALAAGKDLGLDAETGTPTMAEALLAEDPSGARLFVVCETWLADLARPPALGPRLESLIEQLRRHATERLDALRETLA